MGDRREYVHAQNHSSKRGSCESASNVYLPYRSTTTGDVFAAFVALSGPPGARSAPLACDLPSSPQNVTVLSPGDTHIVRIRRPAHKSALSVDLHPATAALGTSGSIVADPAPCMLVAQKLCTVPSLVQLLPCVVQGLQVSLRCILQN